MPDIADTILLLGYRQKHEVEDRKAEGWAGTDGSGGADEIVQQKDGTKKEEGKTTGDQPQQYNEHAV